MSVPDEPIPAAFFVRDGDDFVPTWIAQGPWGSTVSGNVVGGILAWAIERDAADHELQPARLTVDLLRPPRSNHSGCRRWCPDRAAGSGW
jgi:hypothetical protein